MSSPGPVDVHVDFAELGRVHTELQNLLARVEGLDELCAIHPDGNSMGCAVAADAIAQFGERWRAARNTLTANTAGCLTYVELAAENYGRTELTIGDAVKAGTAIGLGMGTDGGGGEAW